MHYVCEDTQYPFEHGINVYPTQVIEESGGIKTLNMSTGSYWFGAVQDILVATRVSFIMAPFQAGCNMKD